MAERRQIIKIRLFTTLSQAQELDYRVHRDETKTALDRGYTTLFSDLIHSCRGYSESVANWFSPAIIEHWDVTALDTAVREQRVPAATDYNSPVRVDALMEVTPGSDAHLIHGPLNLFALDLNCLYKHSTHWSIGWVLAHIFSHDFNEVVDDDAAIKSMMGRAITHQSTNGGFDVFEHREGVLEALNCALRLLRRELPNDLADVTFVRGMGRFLYIFFK